MIVGVVNQNLEPAVPLVVRTADGRDSEIEAVIDTGFSGFLTLPSTLVAALQLTWIGREDAMLGDGHTYPFDVYSGTVVWNGQPRNVEVNATDTVPLIGMAMIFGHELRIAAVNGGIVTIESLP